MAVLVNSGLLDLDLPVQSYVPYFPEKRWQVTTRQVAHHTAGIRHYRHLEFLSNVHFNSVEHAISVFAEDTLLFEPGSKYEYSSYGWNLISAVLEGASGMPFLELMDSVVFRPLGMKNTYADDIFKRKLPRVAFYHLADSVNAPAPVVDNSVKWAGGGFISTAGDLIRFGEGMLSHTLVDEKTTDHFWTPGTLNDGKHTNYGLGWAVNEDKHGNRWVGHAGGSVGGVSMLLIYPKQQLIVVVLINRSQGRAPELAFRIADQFLAN
jgi:CubicO group peptidase (beta-lactamase class C family)